MTNTYQRKNDCLKTFNVAALIIYCIVQVSQVLSRSKFLVVQYLKKSLLNRVHLLLFNREGTLQEITIISRTTFLLMYVYFIEAIIDWIGCVS